MPKIFRFFWGGGEKNGRNGSDGSDENTTTIPPPKVWGDALRTEEVCFITLLL